MKWRGGEAHLACKRPVRSQQGAGGYSDGRWVITAALGRADSFACDGLTLLRPMDAGVSCPYLSISLGLVDMTIMIPK